MDTTSGVAGWRARFGAGEWVTFGDGGTDEFNDRLSRNFYIEYENRRRCGTLEVRMVKTDQARRGGREVGMIRLMDQQRKLPGQKQAYQ